MTKSKVKRDSIEMPIKNELLDDDRQDDAKPQTRNYFMPGSMKTVQAASVDEAAKQVNKIGDK